MDGAPRAELVARPLPDLLPVEDAREPLRVLIASLVPGGAERIVLEWLGAEAPRERGIELAVLHRRGVTLPVPEGVHLRVRGAENLPAFMKALARDWAHARSPVSTHLVGDGLLRILWDAGIATVPVVHNAAQGWRNDPSGWPPRSVPAAIACASRVGLEVAAAGFAGRVHVLRHRPRVDEAAFDPAHRARIRDELRIGPRAFVVGAVGALKPQKDYPRAVEVLAHLARARDACLVILGGALDRAGHAELDRIAQAAADRGIASRLRLPGFVDPIAPWYAAFDAVLNVSRFEGLSMATREALAAGVPVVATDVGGQAEIGEAGLVLVGPGESPRAIAARLAALPLRTPASPERVTLRAPRAWSLPLAWRRRSTADLDALFVTANLNTGGAQRSLVNLATTIAGRRRIAVAVCGESTGSAFASRLRQAGIDAFRPAATADPFAVAESLLATAQDRGARHCVFWNVDPKVKLLVTKFAPGDLSIVDVSPGHYAFEELEAAAAFAEAIDHSVADCLARLDALVLKYAAAHVPAVRRVAVIPNGVAPAASRSTRPASPRFLVSGRLAPSKRLEVVIDAFERFARLEADATLELVGDAQPRDAAYLESLRARSHEGAVIFRGPRDDLAHLAEPWTATVVLGTHQGSPNAVLEAMAAGIPVIANDSGGTRELVVDGDTGWLLPEDTTAERVAEAMAAAWREPGPAGERAARALDLVDRQHGLERMAHDYLRLLDGEGPGWAT